MIVFAVGVWVGAALGACLMGALWAQDRRGTETLATASMPIETARRVTRRRAAHAVQLH